MLSKISSMLDDIANSLEAKGLLKEAFEIDRISNTLENPVLKQMQDIIKKNHGTSTDGLEWEMHKGTNGFEALRDIDTHFATDSYSNDRNVLEKDGFKIGYEFTHGWKMGEWDEEADIDDDPTITLYPET